MVTPRPQSTAADLVAHHKERLDPKSALAHLQTRWGSDCLKVLNESGLLPKERSNEFDERLKELGEHIETVQGAVKEFQRAIEERCSSQVGENGGQYSVSEKCLNTGDLEVIIESLRCACGDSCLLCSIPEQTSAQQRYGAKLVAHDIQHIETCISSQTCSWVAHITFAECDDGLPGDKDVCHLSVQAVRDIMDGGHPLTKPIFVPRSGEPEFSNAEYSRKMNADDSQRWEKFTRRLDPDSPSDTIGHIIIPSDLSGLDPPGFLGSKSCSRLPVMSSPQPLGDFRHGMGSVQPRSQRPDCMVCNIVASAGALSGSCLTKRGKLCVQVVSGHQLALFVPRKAMTPNHWRRFVKDGGDWNPKDLARAVPLGPGDTLVVDADLPLVFYTYSQSSVLVIRAFEDGATMRESNDSDHLTTPRLPLGCTDGELGRRFLSDLEQGQGSSSDEQLSRKESLVSDFDQNPSLLCPICEGNCSHCDIPSSTPDELRDAMYRAAHDAHEIAEKNGAWKPYTDPVVQYASFYRPELHECGESPDSAHAWMLSGKKFAELSQSGQRFEKPVVIVEPFPDDGQHSPLTLAESLHKTYSGKQIPIREGEEPFPRLQDVSELVAHLRDLSAGTPVLNALSLNDVIKAIRPHFTSLGRFQALDRVVDRLKATRSNNVAAKQVESVEVDVESCLAFNIFACSRAFSGMHRDVLGGTWLRQVWGRKIFWFVNPADMTEEDWAAFSRQGDTWKPGGKARAVLLQGSGLMFFIGCPHAAGTIDPTCMTGGMFWDELGMEDILDTITHIALNPNTSNELLPYQLRAIIDTLGETLDPEHPLQEHVARLRKCGCECDDCSKSCPCTSTRCNSFCHGHDRESHRCMREDKGNDDISETSDITTQKRGGSRKRARRVTSDDSDPDYVPNGAKNGATRRKTPARKSKRES